MSFQPTPATGAIPIPKQPRTLADRPGQRAFGVGLVLAGGASGQLGGALGALAFPVIGPVGVVAIRQLVALAVLLPAGRPRLLRYGRAEWLPILGLALGFSVMNLALYSAVERIGLGLAVTLEFLGPLTIALLGTRRLIDLGCAIVAAGGVLALTHPGPSTDALGIAFGLIAGCAWAMYILLNRRIGRVLPGLEGSGAASLVACLFWAPVAVIWFASHTPTLPVILLAAACGVLSSAVPYVVDLLALRRVPASLFGVLTSCNPVCAALFGWMILGQQLALVEWAGVALIVMSSAVASARGVRGVRAPAVAHRSGRR